MVMEEKMEKIRIENLSIRYSDGNESLRNINLSLKANEISVLFGPAGGGKSTLLRTMNRLNDLADVDKQNGAVYLNGENILDDGVNVTQLRRRVGMVFSRPVPLPLSIYDNVVYGLVSAGEKNKAVLDEAVERSLKQAYVWDEVYDRLNTPAHALSGGQQQRVCLARVLAQEPEVILLDEPTSALDPVSTAKIEQTLQELKKEFTIILVPHNTQQAARVADFAAFFLQGELIEANIGEQLFSFPRDIRTEEYIEGRFG
jgi:phosphate transport system ATP-binding protein